MEDICREIGARLRALRRDRGYTLTEFAEIVHRSKSTLSKYERGEIAVDMATLDELARALGKSASERYRWFLSNYPGLIDRVPHRHIASFLNMTPVTLSRLRRAEREK